MLDVWNSKLDWDYIKPIRTWFKVMKTNYQLGGKQISNNELVINNEQLIITPLLKQLNDQTDTFGYYAFTKLWVFKNGLHNDIYPTWLLNIDSSL